MSATIDEKVVEMRFDNRDFENNIKDTMKTLEEFKKQLNFSGASDGLENISKAANKVNFNSLNDSIDTVKVKFSALDVIGVTALQNITNQAMNAGQRLAKALTIDNYIAGWSKYEQKTANVQTIMNATGKSIEEVNEVLDRLMWFSDETSYSFTDMTSALSTMTSKGGDVDKSVRMIWGIAEATAYAGKSSEEFTRVIRNLTQSYSSGFLNLMDWKSIELANVNSKQLMQTLIEAGEQLGTIKKGEVTLENFNDKLKDKWANTKVMETAFGKWASMMEDAEKLVNESKLLGNEISAAEAIEQLSGKYEDYVENATKAAQTSKTFTEAIDATKDAVSSAFMRMYESIFGNYEEAKVLWSDVTEALYDYLVTPISKVADFVDEVMKHNPFKPLIDNMVEVTTDVKNIVKPLEDYGKVVDEIINGKWSNGETRWKKLTEAGYDWAHAQNLVNEKLGSSVRHNTEFNKSQQELADTEKEISESTAEYIQKLSEMDDTTLLSVLGDQNKVESVRELQREADKLGITVKDLIENSDRLSGRDLLIQSFTNIGETIISFFGSIKEAWSDIFKDNNPLQRVYDIIAGFHKFTAVIRNYVLSNSDNLIRSLKGLFSVFDILSTVVKGFVKVALTPLKFILKGVSKTTGGLLDVTANVGDCLVILNNLLKDNVIAVFDDFAKKVEEGLTILKDFVFGNEYVVNALNWLKDTFYNSIRSIKDFLTNNEKLRNFILLFGEVLSGLTTKIVNWFKNTDIINTVYKNLSTTISNVTTGIKDWFENNERLKETFDRIKESIDKAKASITEWFNSLSSDENKSLGENIVDGIAHGISYAAGKVWEAILKVAQKIKEIFCGFFGIASPSKESETWGKYIVEGLKNGLKNNFPKIYEVLKIVYDNVKDLSFGMVSSIITPLTAIFPQLKFLDLPKQFLNLFKACGIDSIEGLKIGLEHDNGVVGKIKEIADKIISVFKGEIDAHSPSKVFIAIGGMIMAGLAIGLSQGFENFPETIKGFANRITEMFKKITLGKIIGVGVGVGVIFVIREITNLVNTLGTTASKVTSPITALSNAIGSIGKSFSTFTDSVAKARNKEANATLIKSVAASILMIAGALYIISKVKQEDLVRSAVVLGIITAVVAAIVAFIAFLSSKAKIINIGFSSGNAMLMSLLLISGSILLFALGIKAISKLDLGDKEEQVMSRLITIIKLMAGLLAVSLIAGKNAKKAGAMILKISLALLIMIKVIKALNELGDSEVDKAMTSIEKMTSLFTKFIVLSIFAGRNSKKAGIMMISMAAAMYVMVKVIKAINELKDTDIDSALTVIDRISNVFIKVIAVSLIARHGIGASIIMLTFTGAIYLMIGAIKLINTLSDEELNRGLKVIKGIGLVFGAVIAVTSLITGKNAIGAAGVMLSFSLSIFLMIGAISLLTLISDEEIKHAGFVIGQIGILFGVLMALSRTVSKGKFASKNIIAIAMAIGVIAASLALLSFVDQDKLKSSAMSLGGVMVALGFVIRSVGKIQDVKGAIGTLATIAIFVAVLSGILWLLSKLDAKNTLMNAGAMSILLVSIGLMSKILSKDIVKIDKSVLITLGTMTAAIGIIAVILKLLDGINPVGAIANAAAIGVVLLSMTVAMIALKSLPKGDVSIGALLGLGVVIGIIGGILKVLDGINPKDAILNALAISELLLVMSGVLVILGFVKDVSNDSIIAMALLGVVVAELAIIFGVMQHFNVQPSVETATALSILLVAMTGVLGVLAIIGNTGTSALVGALNLVGVVTILLMFCGILGAINEIIPDLQKFINEGGEIFASIGTIIGKFVGNLLAGAAGPIMDLLPEFGKKLTSFMVNALPFFNMMKVLGPDTMSGIKTLAEAMIAITAAELISGITKFFHLGDGNALSNFASQLAVLGMGLDDFVSNLGSFDDSSSNKVKAAAEAIKALAEANKTLPNSGGWIDNIIGNNDFNTWAPQLGVLAMGLDDFVSNLGSFDESSSGKVEAAAEAIKALAEANETLPNSGGWLGNIVGNNDFNTWAPQLGVLAMGLDDFVSNLGSFDESSIPIVKTACEILRALSDVNESVTNLNNTTFTNFAGNLKILGSGLNNFITNLKGESNFTTNDFDLVYAACTALSSISTLANDDLTGLSGNLKDFGDNLAYFGLGINSFITDVSSIGSETIQECIDKVQNLINMASTIAAVNIESISTFTDSLIKVANDGVIGFCKAFEDAIPTDKVKKAVMKMMDFAISGAETKRKPMVDKFKQISEECIEKVRSFYGLMKQAGMYFTQGFVDGINEKAGAASAAAFNMALGAVIASKSAIDSASPSKETHKLGNYFGEGFVIGIKDYFGKVYDAAYNSGDLAKEGLSNAITKISSMIEDGIDTSPTITPVLDLSNVKAGAEYLGSMFGSNSIGVNENVNSITNGFNSRIQNGGNLDLLNAINKLEATVRGSNGNTLNIYSQELDSEKLDQIVKYVNKELGVIF